MLTLTYKCFLSGKRVNFIPLPRCLSSVVKAFQEDGFIQQYKVLILIILKVSDLLCLTFKDIRGEGDG